MFILGFEYDCCSEVSKVTKKTKSMGGLVFWGLGVTSHPMGAGAAARVKPVDIHRLIQVRWARGGGA